MKSNRLDLISESKEKFFDYVKKCNGNYRLISPSLYLYKKVIEKHNKCDSYKKLYEDNEFLELIYMTLIAWNMNQRRAKLVSFEEFRDSILENQNQKSLNELSTFHLKSLSNDELNKVLEKIEKLFKNIKVMKSKSKIVGISKTLHFLLPNLIMPMDRKYTMCVYSKDIEKEFKTFKKVFIKFHEIIKRLHLTDNDINNFNWNTSIPKLIDNALIGFNSK